MRRKLGIECSVENDFTDFPQEGTQKLIEGSRKDKVLRDGHVSKAGKMTSEVNGAERPFLTSKHISYFGGGTAQKLF